MFLEYVNNSSSSIAVGEPARASRLPKWLGKRVGRYRLVSLLGVGSWGKVFEAEDTTLRRRVALKLVATVEREGQQKLDFARVIREARAAAALEHPNVTQVYEVGRHKDLFFIAMELAEGGSLEDLVRAGGPMDPVRACQLIADAADALAMAHQCGIVHRDVKPANLLLSRNGRCKVTDFGLAIVDDGTEQATNQRVAGTSYYVAPETIRGNMADARSDVYSLGASLYHLLAGRRPFEGGGRTDVLKAHLERELPDLRDVRPNVDPKLAAVVAKSMHKDPIHRYGSMEQFARALRVFTVAVPPTGASFEAALGLGPITPPRRFDLRKAAPALIGAAAVVLAVAVWTGLRGNGPSPALATGSEVPAQEPPAATAAARVNPSQPTPPAPAVAPSDAKQYGHTFRLDARQWQVRPTTVHVAGDFNAWAPTGTPLADTDGDGVWVATVQVTAGTHQYKFVVDGTRWLNDPAADPMLNVDDGHGGVNNAVVVGPKP